MHETAMLHFSKTIKPPFEGAKVNLIYIILTDLPIKISRGELKSINIWTSYENCLKIGVWHFQATLGEIDIVNGHGPNISLIHRT